jgi:Zn-finger nucleic acid-binding protein
MDCPRCTLEPKQKTGPYRMSAEPHVERPHLTREPHASGLEMDRCPDCGGVWLNAGELERIETRARELKPPPGFRADVDQMKRAYAHAHRPETRTGVEETPPLSCPACGEPMFPREWSIGTLVEVDVCIDCRGVWLDPGELEAIEQIFAGR